MTKRTTRYNGQSSNNPMPDSMRNKRLKRMLITALVAVTASLSYALPHMSGALQAKNMDRIAFANRITSFQPLDARHLVLVADEKMNYLLSLTDMCHELRFAHRIGVTYSENTIYAGFDHIVADGQECSINRIQAISPEMAQRLRP